MFRSAPLAPVRVQTRPVRTGRRVAVFEVTVGQEDGPVGQGTVMLLRRTGQPDGAFRLRPTWDVAAPDGEAPAPPRSAVNRRWTPPWRAWRVGDGGSGNTSMAGGIWVRGIHPLITGEPLTPLVRLSMAADMVSPVANSSDRGLSFINADYTVYLTRPP
jgi:Thioesterase-like superfamily